MESIFLIFFKKSKITATFPLYEQIKTIFKDTDFTSSEGEFLTGKIFEAIEKLDKNFITILLQNEVTKSHFFDVIEKAYVLNQNKLYDFFNAKEYFDSSYTSYSNKIGLIKKDSFIKKCDDVVLAFPYKDCVIEGGMSNEEASKKEIFYNAIISKEEIDRLFEPKVLTNISKFDTNGQSTPKTLSMDDNLILKGNNLLALHSLKARYAGQIKLIYIDPPYNTGNDGFKYNDRFNHSTWLTFMKNRLEVARELLSDDGSIFIQIDHNEQAYLKILMDEIFGRENFKNEIIWKRSQNISSISDIFKRAHDTILFYSKSQNFQLTRLFREHEQSYLKQYDKTNDDNRQYRHVPLLVSGKRAGITGEPWKGIDPNIYGQNGMHWITTHQKLEELDKLGLIYWPKNGQPMRKYFLDESDGRQVDDIWDDIKLISPSSKEGIGFVGQKPEELIKRIFEASTQENDIVLDYHLGSGTTCAVAHKMNRRYIGIEQMDYIETIAVERIKKVIEGEQGGISKALEWKGGGSFVYAELKPIDTFNEADTIGALNQNMRYLPIGEIDDESYGISESEKALNKQFYGVE